MANFTIKQKWSSYFPRLDEESTALLEASILKEGQRDPVVVTQEGIVIDGHNRLEILQRHGIEAFFEEVQLETDDEIESWIISNQLSRRSIAGAKRNYFRGRLVDLTTAAIPSAPRGATMASNEGQPTQLEETLAGLEESEGVKKRQLLRDRDLARSVETLSPAARREFLGTDKVLPVPAIKEVASLPADEQVAAMREWKNGNGAATAKKAKKAGSRGEFLEVAQEGHKQCLQHLGSIKRTLRSLDSDKRSEGYLSTQITRIEELLTDLRGYVTSAEPVKWTGRRWATKVDERQRGKRKRKTDASK